MLSGESASPRARPVRLRTKFVAAFVVQTLLITLLAVGLEQWRIHSGRGSAFTDYLLVGLVALAVALVLGFFTSGVIIRPVSELSKTAKSLAQGDLTQRTGLVESDEIGSLAEAFNAMAASLERTVGKLARSQAQLKSVFETVGSRTRTVVERVDEQHAILDDTYRSVDQLTSGIRKITDNVESLSESSEETSASMLEMAASMEEVTRQTETLFRAVEETATATEQMVSSIGEVDHNIEYLTSFVSETSSAMVEMSASIAQVESNAARSYDLSLTAADAAQTGMRAVGETIQAMEEIRKAVVDANNVMLRLGERSNAVGRILNVIEDVAEQTSLLALNAAILAAQAGEQGKGFSVVAAEIRELSERTSSSTREIGALIGSVQQEVGNALASMAVGTKLVEEGVARSHQAGKALTNILDSATSASSMGKEIAAATNEQAEGSETVTRAVDKLQEMVRQINGATAQQAQGSNHIMEAVESMRDVTRYVRQAMAEQRSGSAMISASAERMIERIHEIFHAATNQSGESEKIIATMQQVRSIAESNRDVAEEMSDSLAMLSEAIRSLDEEIHKFRVRV
ncbi:MAG TPA: methyl-accepting chemotaxis protein [Thermoanaerobaculia bacterium]|nr:methyl-accepting chemotaxis protein [Thermoanaerobaculia bacterium]